jgi:hypothetical protein
MGSLLSFVKKNDHRINSSRTPVPSLQGRRAEPGTSSPKKRGILRQHKAVGQAPAIIRRENWQGIQDIKVQLSRTIEYS